MYERLQELMDMNNTTAYKVSADTGIPTSYFSRWKQLNLIPKTENVITLAKYFNVSTDWLLTGENKPNNQILPSVLWDIIEDADLMSALSMYLASDEKTKGKVVKLIKAICE